MIDLSEYCGRVAVVTGAASGMGLCLSRKICAAGGSVVMCDVNGAAKTGASARQRLAVEAAIAAKTKEADFSIGYLLRLLCTYSGKS